MQGSHMLAIPEDDAVVGVRDEVDDPRIREREREGGEDDAPEPLSRHLCRVWSERGEARVDNRKDDAKAESHQVRVASAHRFERGDEVITIASRRVDPEHRKGG
eukprot:scaffold10560_cov133-Isochrysis_galbana.AAC.9